MKSNVKKILSQSLVVLMLTVGPGRAQEKNTVEIAVAALNLPGGSEGLLHWNEANTATTPLQLSTRYFSERLKLKGRVIRFYENPVEPVEGEPMPDPLIALSIPQGANLGYVVLWSESDGKGEARWRGRVFSGQEWKDGSMKVINASAETLGMLAGEKKIRLDSGKSLDFPASDWRESFPVKIFLMKPEVKNVFSSTWRVTAGRRELCFIAKVNGAISLRSLMDLAAPPVEAP
jgi:hypothetical protein